MNILNGFLDLAYVFVVFLFTVGIANCFTTFTDNSRIGCKDLAHVSYIGLRKHWKPQDIQLQYG